MEIDGKSIIRTLAPTLTTTAYTAGDLLGTEKYYTLTDFVNNSGGTSVVQSISIVEKKDTPNKSAIDVLFFQSAPTIAPADNAQLVITDADMTNKFLGRISLVAGDYAANTSGNGDATKVNCGLLVRAAPGIKDVFVVLQAQGTPTYGVGDLVIKIGGLQD